jgi:hypothetical protein
MKALDAKMAQTFGELSDLIYEELNLLDIIKQMENYFMHGYKNSKTILIV